MICVGNHPLGLLYLLNVVGWQHGGYICSHGAVYLLRNTGAEFQMCRYEDSDHFPCVIKNVTQLS
jgi:hypothetical protein